MQIHEITSRRLNEQGMLGALAKGIGTAVANKFVGATLGIDTRGGGPDDPQARLAPRPPVRPRADRRRRRRVSHPTPYCNTSNPRP